MYIRFRASLIFVIFGSALCACSGGDDGPPPGRDAGHEPDGPPADAPADDAPVDHTPPTITATDPTDGATGVAPAPAITVSFDEPITVSEPADGLQLLDEAGQPVPGAVDEVDGDVLRFVPAGELALLGAYTAVVTPAVTDLAGNPLAGEHRIRLSVRDGAWDMSGTPVENSESGTLRSPDVAMDPRGNVVVVWSQLDPPFSVRASHYDTHTGTWQTAQPIEHDDAGDAVAPRVAMDAAGNAIAVWQQSDGTNDHVWASRYDAGAGWEDPVQLDTGDTGEAFEPRIAMNAGGAAIVVWRQLEDTGTQPWIRRFAAGAGWGAPEPVQLFGQPAFMVGAELAVAIDGHGDAMVLMLDDSFELQAVSHLAASGWAEPEPLQRGPIDGFQIALAPGGAALATWQHAQPSRIHAWRREPGGTSQMNLLMLIGEEERGSLGAAGVTIDDASNGIALWLQHSPAPIRVWAGVYSATAGAWSEPQSLFSTDDFALLRSPQGGMDARGHGHAIWIVADGNDAQALMTARRVAPGAFGAAISYENVASARLAVSAQGKAVIIRAVQSGDGTHLDLDAVFFH